MSTPVEILSRLLWIRDAAVLPDRVVADQLGLEPKTLAALIQAHPERFPESMVFHLTAPERQKIPDAPVMAFTEAGAALLTGLVPGKEAPLLALLPAFADARRILTAQAELSARITALEEKMDLVQKALRADEAESVPDRPIGFVAQELPRGLKAKQRQMKKG